MNIMNAILNVRKLASSSIGLTIPKKIEKKYNIKQGNYKSTVKKEGRKIIIEMEEIF